MPDLYMRIESANGPPAQPDIPATWPIGGYPQAGGIGAPDPAQLMKITGFDHHVKAQIAPMRPSALKAQVRRSYTEHLPMTVHRSMDNGSPYLFDACTTGKVFKAVQLYSCRSEENNGVVRPKPFMTIQLSNVILADYAYRATESEMPAETMQLHYTSIKLLLASYNYTTEQFGANEDKTWNGQTNKSENDQTLNNAVTAENTLFT